jgi:hypothetical protein
MIQQVSDPASSPPIDEGAQRSRGADDNAAVAGFDEAARLEALQHRADGVAREIGRPGEPGLRHRNLDRIIVLGTGEATSAEPQQHSGAAPLAAADQEIGGDGLGDVAVDDRELHQVPPPFRPFSEKRSHCGLGNAREPYWRFGGGGDSSGPAGEDGDVAEPEDRMGEMHDRRIGASENRPHFDDAARQSDQLAGRFAAGLDRRAGLDATPVAARQDRLGIRQAWR